MLEDLVNNNYNIGQNRVNYFNKQEKHYGKKGFF